MKKLVLSIALVAVGSFLMAQQTERKVANKAEMQQKHEAKLQEMKQQLNLSDAQVAQIRALKDKQKADNAKAQDKVQSGRQQSEADMKNILTPEQYTKWQTLKADKVQQKRKFQTQDERELPNAQ